jgi:hypothetical protein
MLKTIRLCYYFRYLSTSLIIKASLLNTRLEFAYKAIFK